MDQNTTLLIAKDKGMYFFPYCADIDIISNSEIQLDVNDEDSLNRIKEIWRKRLAQYEWIIFLDYFFVPEMGEFVRQCSGAKRILFFWNHLTLEKEQLLAKVRDTRSVDEIYSFDPLQAKKYQISHNSSFYQPIPEIPLSREENYDIFFGAANNGRRELAESFKQYFESLGLSVFFHLTELRGNEDENYLTYPDYLGKVFQSKAILEIMREGQTGITLRCLESIFFQKKIITTNRFVKYYHFYHPQNVFILGEDKLTELPQFFKTEYLPVSPEILRFYQPKAWIERFKTNRKESFLTYEYQKNLIK